MLAGAFARMQQHVLDDRVGALAVLHDLVEIAVQRVGDLGDLRARLVVERARRPAPLAIRRSARPRRDEKLLTKLSGFLISWAMPAVSWPSEASFSVCTRRSCAVRRSSSDFASSRVRCCRRLEQPHVLDRDHRLVGEGRHQLDLLVGEWSHVRRVNAEHADRRSLAHQRHAKHGAEAANLLRFGQRVFRIGLSIGDMNEPAFEQRAPDRASRVRLDGQLVH